MRKYRLSWFLICVIFWGAANAEITPGPAAKESGDLGLVIVASGTPKYIEEWLSTPSSHGVTINRLKLAKPEQLIVTSFLVTGMSANDDGNYEFSVSFYILDPNEKPIFGQRDYARGKGELPSKPMLIMADPALDLIFEDSDPEGIYTIVAQVVDLVNGKKASDSYSIKFIKGEL